MKRTIAIALIGISMLGVVACGGSSVSASTAANAQSPAAKLLVRTGASNYVSSGHPKVDSVSCVAQSKTAYACDMTYSFTPPSGQRGKLLAKVPVTCAGTSCHASWMDATEGQTVGVKVVPSSSTSSAATTTTTATTTNTLAAKLQVSEVCIKTEGQYLKLATAMSKVNSASITASIANPSNSVFDGVVANADTLKADLGEIATVATPVQRAGLTQYDNALGQLDAASRDVGGGNLQAALGDLTGVGQEVKMIPSVVGAICKTAGA